MSAQGGSGPSIGGRWRRLPLGLRTALLCFAVIALTGAAVAVFIWSLRSPEEYPPTVSRLVGAILIAAFIVGIVAARRGLRAWLAGYLGAVLAGIPIAVVHDTLVTGAITVVSGSAVGDAILFAVLTGVVRLSRPAYLRRQGVLAGRRSDLSQPSAVAVTNYLGTRPAGELPQAARHLKPTLTHGDTMSAWLTGRPGAGS